MCFWHAVSGAYVGCAVGAVSAALSSWVSFCCDCLSCTCSGRAGCWSQSFVPSCCFCLLSSLGVSAAAFCHLGLLLHPILLLFLAWGSSFGIYSGLGLRCCGPGYGSSLLLGGRSLSLVLVVLAWLLQLFCCPDNLGFLDFLLGFPFDFQCLLVVRGGCFSVPLLSGWVYGADVLSFHFLVSTGFFFSIF